MRPLIYLFDIDGTLVTTAGSGRRALCAAFLQRYGSSTGLEFSFDGMTDKAIIALALHAMNLPLVAATLEQEIEQILAAYIAALQTETKVSKPAFEVHAGVPWVLEQVRNAGRGAVGLGTGNIRQGAEIKLGAVNLYHHFAFGGFGCDHHNRTELLAIGAARGAAQLGHAREKCDVLVIGDTPKDIAAAHGIGARCLAVSTGNFSTEALVAAGADVAVTALDTPQALEVLLGPATR